MQHLEDMAPRGNAEYRKPKYLRFELGQHIGIFFEEKLYTQALNLLFNTLASGSYASPDCIIPLPPHLAIAVTFLVHPTTTTRATSSEEQHAAHVALRLLRLLGTLVSPREAKLNTAFAFTHDQFTRSGRRIHDEDGFNNPRTGENRSLGVKIGEEESLWSRAEDFWHAVGWSFNCSMLHPERWERWQIWLEYMCDVLLDDWDEREFIFKQRQAESKVVSQETTPLAPKKETVSQKERNKAAREKRYEDTAILRESLLFQYISAGEGYGKHRRIMRAVFADGSSHSVNEFRQIFPKELKPAKSDRKPEKAKKRERDVNIDQEEYGDYLAQDDTDDGATTGAEQDKPPGLGSRRSKRTRRGTRKAKDPSGNESVDGTAGPGIALAQHDVGVSPMGALDSLDLRKRLMFLLSRVSQQIPEEFLSILDLYHLFVEQIRHLPLPTFQAFISPYILPGLAQNLRKDPGSDENQTPCEEQTWREVQGSDAEATTLCELLLFSMLESAAPQTGEEYLDQNKLEKCFLPFAAANASVVDNAKISILLEALLVLLAGSGGLVLRPSLQEAVQVGIKHRVDRGFEEIRRGQAKKQKEPLEWSWLIESGHRLLLLLEVLQVQSTGPS
ncbi:hypothetical protein N7532_011828 [Penicillium argentinense]|uniref:Uncharacterized protein n=1 Tax=Penicillium argentinense TaxID=1131581 RepID=A0A9W9JVB5_9EURO|nr:uncharacterized protein N7532_011828 [Penicillium argentinense]KAJ5082785.1 hypothetical protein N7532_011828 [Penicillium argentinense]